MVIVIVVVVVVVIIIIIKKSIDDPLDSLRINQVPILNLVASSC
jgi:hypothetical protein